MFRERVDVFPPKESDECLTELRKKVVIQHLGPVRLGRGGVKYLHGPNTETLSGPKWGHPQDIYASEAEAGKRVRMAKD